MSVEMETIGPHVNADPTDCAGCGGAKQAPIAGVLRIRRGHSDVCLAIALCEECGRDVANAVGFACMRAEGWSKLEPRKRKPDPLRRTGQKTLKKLQRDAR